MYSAQLLDHFAHPRNAGQLDPALPGVVVVDVANPACGDQMRLSARFESGRVAEARFQVRGCTASIAAGSALTEWMQGRTASELVAPDLAAAIESAVGGLESASKHAAVLCADAVRQLLRSHGR